MDSTAPTAAAPTPSLDLTQALPFPVVLVDERGVVLQTNPAFDQAFGPRAPGVDRLPGALLDADTLAELPARVRRDETVRLCSLRTDEQPVYEVVARRVAED
ncbi:MAG: hypothetical protein KC583_16285, partial [Myxococcales bacterium]|nr:hypothetical protein [Myxococcales bacterium]